MRSTNSGTFIVKKCQESVLMISPSSVVINMYNYLLGIMKKFDSLPIAVHCDNGKYMIFLPIPMQ